MIPQETVEEIKARNEISDVISSYVPLKRAGSNLNGLCPFHSEKTPSFTVFPSTSNFYCFGCGTGGDVITFIMKMENLAYPDALEFLAKRAGITIPSDGKRDSGKAGMRRRVLDCNRAAARFFNSCLYSDAGREGYNYLKDVRGLSDGVIKHFGLGYAPNDFSALTRHLSSLGFSVKEMSEAFLCRVSEKNGRPYDLFRGRVMFPRIDVTGEVVAFGGRVMDDSKPKYLNTSDTPAFKKTRNLFALNFAKRHCAEQMILCEGYMDVIALHSAGFPQAVATLGTAITQDQARIMAKYTKSVMISYDADAAGQKAAEKAFSYLSEVGLDTKILRMEGAKDPDEYIKKFGAVRFKGLLAGGRSRFDFSFDNIVSRYDLSLPDDRISAAREVSEVLAGIYSQVERDVYTHRASEKLSVPFESLRSDVDRLIRKKKNAARKDELRQTTMRTEGYGDRVNPDYVKNVRASKAEESIIGILLSYPEYINLARERLTPEDFFSDFGKRVYAFILEHFGGGELEFGLFNGEFSERETGRIMQMKVMRDGVSNGEQILSECIDTLKDAKNRKSMNIDDIIKMKRRK